MKNLRLYDGECDCEGGTMAKGAIFKKVNKVKKVAPFLKKCYMSGKIYYAIHWKGKHVLFAYLEGHWWPHIHPCELLGCKNNR